MSNRRDMKGNVNSGGRNNASDQASRRNPPGEQRAAGVEKKTRRRDSARPQNRQLEPNNKVAVIQPQTLANSSDVPQYKVRTNVVERTVVKKVISKTSADGEVEEIIEEEDVQENRYKHSLISDQRPDLQHEYLGQQLFIGGLGGGLDGGGGGPKQLMLEAPKQNPRQRRLSHV